MIAEFHTEYRSRLVAIGDWICRPPGDAAPSAGGGRVAGEAPPGRDDAVPGREDAAPGHEEASPRHAIVFVRSGAFRKHVGGRTLLADPANVVFFTRHEPYRISHPVPGGDRCLVLDLEEEALWEIAGREGRPGRRAGRRPSGAPDDPFAAPAVNVDPRLALRLRRLAARAAATPPGGDLEVDEAALLLAGEVLRRAQAARKRPAALRAGTREAHRRAVERARLVAAERFRERLSLETVAREAACSPYHLCRLFRDLAGMPIHRYVIRLRLLAALEGLAPGADLSRLALDAGFASHSHFSAAFRREIGLAPSAARRAIASERLRRFRKNVTASAGAPR